MAGWEESASILEVNGTPYSRQELLAYWIQEREEVRRKKELEPRSPPWSEDPVFQTTYFCNVHREDDKVTKWIRQNYTHALMGDKLETAMTAARLFNRPTTLENIKYHLNPFIYSRVYDILEEMRDRGEKIWSGAYVITTHGQKMDKLPYCLDIIQKVYNLDFDNIFSCQAMFNRIKTINGLGSFLAAQVVADLKYSEGHNLYKCPDYLDFSAPGPGSLRGLSWFFDCNIKSSDYRYLISEVKQIIGWEGDMQDLQNCLCEFDKYCRVAYGTGKSKRGYQGGKTK